MASELVKMDRRGSVVIPSVIRKKLGLGSGGLFLLVVENGNIVMRPAVAVATEEYTPARVAEFLLNNAIDPEDYREAVARVRRMGIDPDSIPHERPDRGNESLP